MEYNRKDAIEKFLKSLEETISAAEKIEEFKMNFRVNTSSSNEIEIRHDREMMHVEIAYILRKHGYSVD